MVAIEQQPVDREYDHPVYSKARVKLTKNTKGFNWEIVVHDDDHWAVLEKVGLINAQLQAEYGGE